METTILDAALTQGIWAVVAVFLMIYIVKANEKRDLRQEEREQNYQSVINRLTEALSILHTVREELMQFREHFISNEDAFGELRTAPKKDKESG